MNEFMENLAKALNAEVHSEEYHLRHIDLSAGSEFTLILAMDSNEGVSCINLCRAVVRNRGSICPIFVEDHAILIGPLRSAQTQNACPQCLVFRIQQKKNPETSAAPKDTLQPWTAWGSSSLCGIVAGLVQYKLSLSDEPTNGRCWMLKAESFELTATHIVKSPHCPLCRDLDAAPENLSTSESCK